MPTFVIGGLLGLMVFLSAFGAWAKQACNCGCFLGLSSCLGIVTMLLELTFAILTLAAKDQVLAAFCKKIAGSAWDSTGKQCTTAGAPSDALGFDDGSGSGGGGHHPDGHKVTQYVLKDYQQWSDIIAYVLFGLAFLHQRARCSHIWRHRLEAATCRQVLDHTGYGFLRTGLVRTNDPCGTTFNPTRRVQARQCLPSFVDHSTLDIANGTFPFIEWDFCDRNALIPYRAKYETRFEDFFGPGRPRSNITLCGRIDFVFR